jgi:hypothetical protein
MPNRAARRAAQRQAFKNACQELKQDALDLAAAEAAESKPTTSAARLAANRANAQKSRGPVTTTGKAASSLNAIKTGLTGRTVLIPSEDADIYQAHILSYEKLYKPIGPEECALVQSIADIRWRLNRIPALEIALLALCRKESAKDHDAFNRTDLSPILEMEIRRTHEKEFRNLHLQESRLARRREKELAELRGLQRDRKANQPAALERTASAYLVAQHRNQLFDNPGIGFEFSSRTFNAYIAGLTSLQKEQLVQRALANATEQPETMPAAA